MDVQRQLRKIYLAKGSAQGAARGSVQKSARAYRAAGSIYQPLPVSGDQGQAGAEPDQRARKDRAYRVAGRREDDSFQFSAAEAERQDCRRVHGSREELSREGSVSRCEI